MVPYDLQSNFLLTLIPHMPCISQLPPHCLDTHAPVLLNPDDPVLHLQTTACRYTYSPSALQRTPDNAHALQHMSIAPRKSAVS